MARVRDTPAVTQNAAANMARKGKWSPDAINIVEEEQPAPGNKGKNTVSKTKRQREVDNVPTIEPEQVVATKKTRTAKGPKASEPQASVRRSDRAHPTTLAAPPKRKRRTKAEIEADKAKADAEKKRKEELAEENQRALAQMDIDEDIDRAEAATRTIKTFTKLEDDSGEEFVGYAEVEDSESEPDGDAEDALTLKVRFPS